jgi:hypothetical protein
MAAPAEAPLAFITFHKGSYDVNPAALQLLSSVQGPLSIVAVAGRYRSVSCCTSGRSDWLQHGQVLFVESAPWSPGASLLGVNAYRPFSERL